MTAIGTAAPSAYSLADWAETLPRYVRHALARMDTTLTLAEAKAELVRVLVERRRTLESGHSC
jgi:hypothetical protein